MVAKPDPELGTSFQLLLPEGLDAPFLFSSPHSGSIYPARFLKAARLDARTLRRSEDFCVDELFASTTRCGAQLLRALFPRAYLDVNREPYELDPRMFAGRLPAIANTRSLRVAGGLGTIARIVADQQEIYRAPLAVDDALDRIEHLYKPYHRALSDQLTGLRNRFGMAVLIDCHSMPSTTSCEEDAIRPDFVLGDRYGTSCACGITDAAQDALEALGYTVRRNKPYAGGYITERYGDPARRVHALQIEINRGLYMDERALTKTSGFARLQADLDQFVERLIDSIPTRRSRLSEAAE